MLLTVLTVPAPLTGPNLKPSAVVTVPFELLAMDTVWLCGEPDLESGVGEEESSRFTLTRGPSSSPPSSVSLSLVNID